MADSGPGRGVEGWHRTEVASYLVVWLFKLQKLYVMYSALVLKQVTIGLAVVYNSGNHGKSYNNFS